MRSRKIEDIRRLICGAIGMCDFSGLEDTKKRLKGALSALDSAGEKVELKKFSSSAKTKDGNFPNPFASIKAIEEEMKKEFRRLSEEGSGAVFSE